MTHVAERMRGVRQKVTTRITDAFASHPASIALAEGKILKALGQNEDKCVTEVEVFRRDSGSINASPAIIEGMIQAGMLERKSIERAGGSVNGVCIAEDFRL